MCKRQKKTYIFWIVFLGLVLVVSGCSQKSPEEVGFSDVEEISEEAKEQDGAKKESVTPVYVDVCGQVKTPGVYCLEEGCRVYEAIEKAGGLTENAAVYGLNQAEKVSDGQKIYVPSEKELENTNMQTGSAASVNGPGGGKVNINTASREELMTLPGIGEVKADAIIRYRSETGSFRSIEDIKQIEGIKEGVFEKIKEQITV